MISLAGVRGRWCDFWFSHGSARNVAVARCLAATQALWLLLSRDYPAISGLPEVFWSAVPTSTKWRYLLFPGQYALESVIAALAVVALVCVLLGIYARAACLIAALLLYHLAPLEGIIWMSSAYVRGLTIPLLALLVLSCARCDDELALKATRRDPPDPGLDYSWQLRLIQVFIAQIYLFSGWSKIQREGLAWMSGDNIRRWILYLVQDPDFAVYQRFGLWLADQPVLCSLIGVGTVLFEFGFILALFSKRLRPWLVSTAIAMHVGIVFSMNLTFVTTLMLLVFFDWESAAARWSGWRRTAAPRPQGAGG